ncbi:hypothetical protein [Streptomyces sp. bgisy091]|uniref:hypothetical protein n=1 Tax=Streptomyces sp. bgisy091 TaxID=3413778 RepID=UPI003D729D41
MAMLCVVIPAVALAWAVWLVDASTGAGPLLLFTLLIGPPAFLAASAVLTAVCVLPSVALGHRLGLLAGHGKRWWWVAVSNGLILLPTSGLPSLAGISQSSPHEWRQLVLEGLLFAGTLWVVSIPASTAVHIAVLRAEEGRPVRPVMDILLWGTLGLLIEITTLLVRARG